ncbi:hypothetical protein ASPZODRAFT_134929 [Penicilliopsis zonata CBS 506.65]|uniref:BZIP domain-containing protein n=1 Tax=Penicilliopsis zonata CBS 506.65 TaxID=1073090 RepID=A0A1L9SCB8_9EURO|nr:hypothetical protein ASPZODRAFT_134929 [Penicilliopsis zonata CBS 506.65]OJJ44793.1 hypothetical protein ASPZODRAFT_134929 [Penicilliopsis zonata CBS 506.65]
MSLYNGRRAPNFSQYLDDLNSLPSAYDQTVRQQQESYDVDNELALFTNTEFFDFDNFGGLDLPTFAPLETDGALGANMAVDQNQDLKFLDMLNDGLGNVPEFSSTEFDTTNIRNMPMQPAASLNEAGTLTLPPAPRAPPSHTPSSTQSSSGNASVTTAPTPSSTAQNASSDPAPAPAPTSSSTAAAKPKSSIPKPKPLSVEEVARVAADEDKRRRNTAASARFRVKKKLREQTLERTVKETSEKNAALEARVSQLELENQWLKNLITEKNGGESEKGKKSESEIAEMFNKFLASHNAASERGLSESKNGVGTAV